MERNGREVPDVIERQVELLDRHQRTDAIQLSQATPSRT
eukprot:CAMPEP_0182589082 /NCGR_PEP_ID=MMETSP1324-20130603/68759_1 /TAXON_ID=236786 /ORGANISM="Florenciella sp., Strain RCC1587" /LENGTH=38 /DNA_ID= /DNA_START= /DNA_END= /DNA_ORIENTATION=